MRALNWPNEETCVRYDSEALDNLGGEAGLSADIVNQHLSLSCFFDSCKTQASIGTEHSGRDSSLSPMERWPSNQQKGKCRRNCRFPYCHWPVKSLHISLCLCLSVRYLVQPLGSPWVPGEDGYQRSLRSIGLLHCLSIEYLWKSQKHVQYNHRHWKGRKGENHSSLKYGAPVRFTW